jgi:GNAT superfamily N-acetyltransferase
MNFREALITDIPQLTALSNHATIPQQEYEDYLIKRGKGWVCEVDGKIVGFAIGDLEKNTVWALFVQPGFEEKGIDRELLILLLDWYYSETRDTIWASAAPDSRAANFLKSFGFTEAGILHNLEIKFELTADDWGA